MLSVLNDYLIKDINQIIKLYITPNVKMIRTESKNFKTKDVKFIKYIKLDDSISSIIISYKNRSIISIYIYTKSN